MNNILILSAGRRVDLVQAFQSEIKRSEKNIKVFTADMNPDLSSACQVSDGAFKISRATSTEYTDELKKLCLDHKIGMIIPTIDTELLILAKIKKDFAELGVTVIVSDLSLVEICRDKRRTGELFKTIDVNTPKIYSSDSIVFPCFIKPYDGSSSIGAFKAGKKEDISLETITNTKMMFMEYVNPKEYSEYTIDMYFDRQSTLKCLVPRLRIETRSGEVSKGVTRRNSLYHYLQQRFIELPGAIGCITLQVFFNELTEKVYGIEINPRFGGGYPLAYSAGANYPSWLIQEYFDNKNIHFFDQWEENLLMLRYDSKVLKHDFK